MRCNRKRRISFHLFILLFHQNGYLNHCLVESYAELSMRLVPEWRGLLGWQLATSVPFVRSLRCDEIRVAAISEKGFHFISLHIKDLSSFNAFRNVDGVFRTVRCCAVSAMAEGRGLGLSRSLL